MTTVTTGVPGVPGPENSAGVYVPGQRNADLIGAAAAARALWRVAQWARTGSDRAGVTAADDDVYRFYLPWARAFALDHVDAGVDLALAEQAAELGLAKAVLAWGHPDGDGFAGYAAAAVHQQIGRIPRPPASPGASDPPPGGPDRGHRPALQDVGAPGPGVDLP